MHYSLGGFSMYLWMFVQWGLLIVGIYLIIRWIKKTNLEEYSHQEDSAVRILRERYARGDISEDEFDYMMKRLKKG